VAGDLDPPARESTVRLLRRAQQAANALLSDALAVKGAGTSGDGAALTPAQHALLEALRATPKCDQISISRTAGIDRSTVADVVARLRARGYVTRSRDRHDARRNIVQLTAAGYAVLDRLDPVVHQAQEALLEPLGTAGRDELARLLDELVRAHAARVPRAGAERGRPPATGAATDPSTSSPAPSSGEG
jgi:MarR family transcriptional regulator, temperature-dependent positive regulator of motility